MMKAKSKILFTLIFVLLISTAGFFFYRKSVRTLTITGFAHRNDSVNLIINNKSYPIKLDNHLKNGYEILIYKKLLHNSYRENDDIRVMIDSSGKTIIDTTLVLNKKNTHGRVFLKDPVETNYKRKVCLLNDSAMIIY